MLLTSGGDGSTTAISRAWLISIVSLFLFHYENNLTDKIDSDFIEYLEKSIQNKQEEINEIKNKLHWHWVKANSELEKQLIREYVQSQA